MHQRPSERAANAIGKAAFVLACLAWSWGDAALASAGSSEGDQKIDSYLPAFMRRGEELYLEVIINDYRTGILSAFRRHADGCLTIDASDLKQFNLKAPESAVHGGGGICLEKMPSVTYRYDAPTQSIYLTVTDDARVPLAFDARGPKPESVIPDQEHSLSAIFNYVLFANFGGDDLKALPSYQGVGASIDVHFFSHYGNFDQSFALRSTVTDSEPNLLRLDSRWSYNDAGKLTTYAAGDIVSGSLAWTRAMRMGGVQIRCDFALQPDLVTQPVPQLAGSAAVPSTVEVYANQSRTFSQEVTGGPFSISNVPVMSGPTTMRLVIRDPSGKETATEYSYYSSPLLIVPGLFDYSIESGFARTYYGVSSDSYDENPIASGSFRYGLTPHFTLEGHAEGGAGLVNGGAGLDFSLWQYGVASLSASASDKGGNTGGQGSGSIETSLWGIKLYARSLRGFRDYQDLVSVTAPKLLLTQASRTITAAQSGAPYKRQDQFSASIPLLFDKSSINFSYTNAEDFDKNAYKIGTLSYNRPFFWDNSTFSLTGFNDFEHRNSYGVYAGVTFSWDRISAGTLAQGSANSASGGGFVSQSLGRDPGSFGYTVRTQEGTSPTNSAAVSYRSSAVLLQAGVQQSGNTSQVSAQAEGSVAILNGVYFANRIDNSFAIVDTGVPGVQILHENHPVGETDSDGKLLIPYMRARELTIITIDPASIPVQADIDGLERKVAPAQRGGMSVHFKGNAHPASAITVFKDEKGTVIPAGSEVWVNGAADAFVIGYDGEAYLTNLAPSNTALVKRPDGTACNASFPFNSQRREVLARIEDVVCAPSEIAARLADAAGPQIIQVKR